MTEDCLADSKIKMLLIISPQICKYIVGDDVLGVPQAKQLCKLNTVRGELCSPAENTLLTVKTAFSLRRRCRACETDEVCRNQLTL